MSHLPPGVRPPARHRQRRTADYLPALLAVLALIAAAVVVAAGSLLYLAAAIAAAMSTSGVAQP